MLVLLIMLLLCETAQGARIRAAECRRIGELSARGGEARTLKATYLPLSDYRPWKPQRRRDYGIHAVSLRVVSRLFCVYAFSSRKTRITSNDATMASDHFNLIFSSQSKPLFISFRATFDAKLLLASYSKPRWPVIRFPEILTAFYAHMPCDVTGCITTSLFPISEVGMLDGTWTMEYVMIGLKMPEYGQAWNGIG